MMKKFFILYVLIFSLIFPITCNAIDSNRYKVINKGYTLVGYTKYKSKAGSNKVYKLGNRPKKLCCSSFVSWCFTKSKVCKIDYSTVDFRRSKKFYRISKKKLLPGDLGFIQDSNKQYPNHVAIYVGKRKGKLIWLHCSGRNNGVAISTDNRLKVFYRYRGFKD